MAEWVDPLSLSTQESLLPPRTPALALQYGMGTVHGPQILEPWGLPPPLHPLVAQLWMAGNSGGRFRVPGRPPCSLSE